jgi:hypothetical protein
MSKVMIFSKYQEEIDNKNTLEVEFKKLKKHCWFIHEGSLGTYKHRCKFISKEIVPICIADIERRCCKDLIEYKKTIFGKRIIKCKYFKI